MAVLLTSVDDKPGSGATKPGLPTGFSDDRRTIVLFDIWLPEGWTFATRGDGLLPCSLFGNDYIPSEKEVEDEVQLIPDGNESSH